MDDWSPACDERAGKEGTNERAIEGVIQSESEWVGLGSRSNVVMGRDISILEAWAASKKRMG